VLEMPDGLRVPADLQVEVQCELQVMAGRLAPYRRLWFWLWLVHLVLVTELLPQMGGFGKVLVGLLNEVRFLIAYRLSVLLLSCSAQGRIVLALCCCFPNARG
jgi:hypothetical protein